MISQVDLNKDSIEGLSELIQLNIDSVDGFRHVAEQVQGNVYRAAFLEIAKEREGQVEELCEFIVFNREDVPQRGSYAAALHRIWISFQDAIDDANLSMICTEIERGESYILGAYKEVLRDAVGSAVVIKTLQKHLDRIQATNDLLRSLHVALE